MHGIVYRTFLPYVPNASGPGTGPRSKLLVMELNCISKSCLFTVCSNLDVIYGLVYKTRQCNKEYLYMLVVVEY